MECLPKLVITDIDGVWTDGGMYYGADGAELKKFNTADSAGVLYLKTLGIPLAIMTGEDTQIVANRAKKLGIEHVYMGVKDKLSLATELCSREDVTLDEVAFIGDDINDFLLLQNVGFACAPANAPDYVKKVADVVTQKAGGQGAFREFVETILNSHGALEGVLEGYFANLKGFQQ